MPKERFNEQECLPRLCKFLPEQSPLKDFIHHNTLHAYQHLPFHRAMKEASGRFGYQTYLGLPEYRAMLAKGKIRYPVLERVVRERKGPESEPLWMDKLLHGEFTPDYSGTIGQLRNAWKDQVKVNLDKQVHPVLFRVVGAYLDQGVSIWKFPGRDMPFLDAVRTLEKQAHWGLFRSPRVKKFLQEPPDLSKILTLLVGEDSWFETYLFDMAFAHPGWSGMIATLEKKPGHLMSPRQVSLRDFLYFELLLELDQLDRKLGEGWLPLARQIQDIPPKHKHQQTSEYFELCTLFQIALEWSYFDAVLEGIRTNRNEKEEEKEGNKPFQALFCIDDRECSLRRYIELREPGCRTYGTAGHFNLDMYFQPEGARFLSKVCPVPVNPGHIVEETGRIRKHDRDLHFHPHSHGAFGGWVLSQLLGVWSAIRLSLSIFRPGPTPAMVSSVRHMAPEGKLALSYNGKQSREGLRYGYTHEEMAERMHGLLLGVGIRNDLDPLVYLIGHGASSVNNTHYAGYDCGACSGRPGSVNSRAAALMLNMPEVRHLLAKRGIFIPETTWFIAGLHDTTRDEILFYDESEIPGPLLSAHEQIKRSFTDALSDNARERARRFSSIDLSWSRQKIHKAVIKRSMSLFEPRPEWNHANNALCLIGKRERFEHLFLDRRAFMHSYDAGMDTDGKLLANILETVIPVCGGINLEYYFSRVDNNRLGAGSKLSHNVAGLIGVVNGIDGDLRTGLPMQMVNIHDPLRMLFVVEQKPDVVVRAMEQKPAAREWVWKGWVHLVAFDPESKVFFRFEETGYVSYSPSETGIEKNTDIRFEQDDSLPVYQIRE